MTFGSVYEILTPLSTVRKTKFWDWFDGDDLRSWWTKTNTAGVGTFAMVDAVDEGFSITCGTASNDGSNIDMNNINHYSAISTIVISVFRRVTATAASIQQVTANDNTTFTHYGLIADDTDFTNYVMITRDGTTQSNQEATFARDAAFHSHKMEFGSANVKATIDGGLEITKTTNRPTADLQPVFRIFARGTGGKEGRIRYMEAYST